MKASTLSNVVGWIGDLLAGLLENISICKQTGILSQWTSASDNPSVGRRIIRASVLPLYGFICGVPLCACRVSRTAKLT